MFFQRINIRYGLQVAIAMVASLLLAELLKLTNPIAAGVVTLATIQTTRRETLEFALKRLLVFIAMIFMSLICFNTLGFSVYSYAFFVLIFISLNSYFDTLDVVSSNIVMAASFIVAGNTSIPVIINECLVFVIGVGIGVVVNILAPVFSKNFYEEKNKLDDMLRELFYIQYLRFKGIYNIEDQIVGRDLCHISDRQKFRRLNKFIDESIEELMQHKGDMLLTTEHYYTDYFLMRKRQAIILKKIWEDSKDLDTSYEEAKFISGLMKDIYDQYHETNTNEKLLASSSKLLEFYRNKELPKTREEFENRAKLFQVLNQTIALLMIKYNFVKELSGEIRKKYWIGG